MTRRRIMAHFSGLTFPAMGPLADRDEVTVKLSHSPSGAPREVEQQV